MADTKLTDLTELAAAPAADDLVEIVDVSDTSMAGTGTNKKIKVSNLSVVVAVRSVTITGTQTTTSTTWVDVNDGTTALSITYTPTSTANKILITGSVTISGNQLGAIRLDRGGTTIAVGAAASSRTQCTVGGNLSSNYQTAAQAINFLDSPATTSSTTWKVQFVSLQGSSVAINRNSDDGDGAYSARTISTLTIMEVAP